MNDLSASTNISKRIEEISISKEMKGRETSEWYKKPALVKKSLFQKSLVKKFDSVINDFRTKLENIDEKIKNKSCFENETYLKFKSELVDLEKEYNIFVKNLTHSKLFKKVSNEKKISDLQFIAGKIKSFKGSDFLEKNKSFQKKNDTSYIDILNKINDKYIVIVEKNSNKEYIGDEGFEKLKMDVTELKNDFFLFEKKIKMNKFLELDKNKDLNNSVKEMRLKVEGLHDSCYEVLVSKFQSLNKICIELNKRIEYGSFDNNNGIKEFNLNFKNLKEKFNYFFYFAKQLNFNNSEKNQDIFNLIDLIKYNISCLEEMQSGAFSKGRCSDFYFKKLMRLNDDCKNINNKIEAGGYEEISLFKEHVYKLSDHKSCLYKICKEIKFVDPNVSKFTPILFSLIQYKGDCFIKMNSERESEKLPKEFFLSGTCSKFYLGRLVDLNKKCEDVNNNQDSEENFKDIKLKVSSLQDEFFCLDSIIDGLEFANSDDKEAISRHIQGIKSKIESSFNTDTIPRKSSATRQVTL